MEVEKIPLDKIERNKNQPRKYFDQEYIKELATSIEKDGLMQPITVRPYKDRYQIIIGECRYRAHQLLKKKEIDAFVKDVSEISAYTISLNENLKRKNLSAIEEAKAYEHLKKFYKQKDIAKEINVSKGRISQKLSILKLPKCVHKFFYDYNKDITGLTEKHARELRKVYKCFDMLSGDLEPEHPVVYDWNPHGVFLLCSPCARKVPHDIKKSKEIMTYIFAKEAFLNQWTVHELEEAIGWAKCDLVSFYHVAEQDEHEDFSMFGFGGFDEHKLNEEDKKVMKKMFSNMLSKVYVLGEINEGLLFLIRDSMMWKATHKDFFPQYEYDYLEEQEREVPATKSVDIAKFYRCNDRETILKSLPR